MRAYMSTVNTVERSNYQRKVQELDARAEREARAILAETEPAAGSHQSLTWLGDWAPEFAESLSAFIEQEF